MCLCVCVCVCVRAHVVALPCHWWVRGRVCGFGLLGLVWPVGLGHASIQRCLGCGLRLKRLRTWTFVSGPTGHPGPSPQRRRKQFSTPYPLETANLTSLFWEGPPPGPPPPHFSAEAAPLLCPQGRGRADGVAAEAKSQAGSSESAQVVFLLRSQTASGPFWMVRGLQSGRAGFRVPSGTGGHCTSILVAHDKQNLQKMRGLTVPSVRRLPNPEFGALTSLFAAGLMWRTRRATLPWRPGAVVQKEISQQRETSGMAPLAFRLGTFLVAIQGTGVWV